METFAVGIYFDGSNLHAFPKFPPHTFFNYSLNPPIHKVSDPVKASFCIISSICYEFTYFLFSGKLKNKISMERETLWIISLYDPRYGLIKGKQFPSEFDSLVKYNINLVESLYGKFEDINKISILGVNFKNSFLVNFSENMRFSYIEVLSREKESISDIFIEVGT